jgi:predicted Fe-Mo cluster-binding NifX family protein
MYSKKIAVPSAHPGGLDSIRSGHFGHCEVFTVVHMEGGAIKDISVVENEAHGDGGCDAPVKLLHKNGVQAIIVGGIGMRPLRSFRSMGIDVFYGPEGDTVRTAVESLVDGKLPLINDQQVCQGHGSCGNH